MQRLIDTLGQYLISLFKGGAHRKSPAFLPLYVYDEARLEHKFRHMRDLR